MVRSTSSKSSKNSKKRGGNDLLEPLSATQSFIELDGNRVNISEHIDKAYLSVFQNRLKKTSGYRQWSRTITTAASSGQGYSKTESSNFDIINQQNEPLIAPAPSKRMPRYTCHQSVPQQPHFFSSSANISLQIPLYINNTNDKAISKKCSDLTYEMMKNKIQGYIKYLKDSRAKCKILVCDSTRDGSDYFILKYIFLFGHNMIYIQLNKYVYRNIYTDISINMYNVKSKKWLEFYNAKIKNLYKNDIWHINYDYKYEKVKFEASHRLSQKPSSAKYTLQSLPVELIEMPFRHLYADIPQTELASTLTRTRK